MKRVQSLCDRVYEDVYDRIRRCELRPGLMLGESSLASHYGVSKTPVREALQRLIEDGTVEKYPRRGYLIRPITVRDIQEGYSLRALLEGESARLAAFNITAVQLEELHQLCDERTLRCSAKSYDGAQNRRFHLAIADASGNSRLSRLVRLSHDDIHRVIIMDQGSNQWTMAEHVDVFNALQRRDPEAARRAMIDHIELGRSRLLSTNLAHLT